MSRRDGGVLDTHCSGPRARPRGQAVTADEVAPL